MKKFLILLMVTLLMSLSVPAFAAIGINVNGQDVYSDVPAQNIGGRVMVPVRLIAEIFGANVSWDEARQTVNIVWQPKQVISQQVQPQQYQDNSAKDAQIAAIEKEIERIKSDFGYLRNSTENTYNAEKSKLDTLYQDEREELGYHLASSGGSDYLSRKLKESYQPYFDELEIWHKTEINKINEDEKFALEPLESQLEELYR